MIEHLDKILTQHQQTNFRTGRNRNKAHRNRTRQRHQIRDASHLSLLVEHTLTLPFRTRQEHRRHEAHDVPGRVEEDEGGGISLDELYEETEGHEGH